MKFPFLSRASHDEVVNLLRSEISELKAERKQTLNFILERSAGAGLFTEVNHPVPVKTVGSSGYFARPMNEPAPEVPSDAMDDLKTIRHPRAAVMRLQKAVNDEADNMLSEAQKLIRETVDEGREAAQA